MPTEHCGYPLARIFCSVGSARTGCPRMGRRGVPLLIRGAVTRPETVVPISPLESLQYYLNRMSFPPMRAGRLRNRAFVAMTRGPVAPERLMPESALATLVIEGAQPRLVPAMVRAAEALGVPADAQWVLALGRGDDLQRSVFHLLHNGQRRWVLKFGRVPGAAASFDSRRGGPRLGAIRRWHDRRSRTNSSGLSSGRRTQRLGRDGRARPAIAGAAREATAAAADRSHRRLGPPDESDHGGPGGGLAAGAPPARAGRVARLACLGAPADLVERLPAVPAVLQHNDLGTWNVVTDGRAFMAVDWESARPDGMPLWDLCYFLADALPRLAGLG